MTDLPRYRAGLMTAGQLDPITRLQAAGADRSALATAWFWKPDALRFG